jgi:hypothetical protein
MDNFHSLYSIGYPLISDKEIEVCLSADGRIRKTASRL